MACPRCSGTHTNRDQVRACVEAWTNRRLQVKAVTDKGTRWVGRPVLSPGLEVVPGKEFQTGIPGFIAYARGVIGNTPICWKRTEKEAIEYGEGFMRDTAREKEKKR